MAYVIPDLQTMLDHIVIVRQKYLKQSAAPNPARLKLLDFLDATANLISQLQCSRVKPKEEDLQEICLGAYLFCLESIAAEYRVSNPEFTQGYVYNSGSKLYGLLLQTLNITDVNNLSEVDKLIYLTKFYNNTFKDNASIIEDVLDLKKLDADVVKQQVLERLKSAIHYADGNVKRVIKAIPTEDYLNQHMSKILENYLTKTSSDNPDRKLLANFVVAISKILPNSDDGEGKKYFINRTQRIKMGLLLYIMQSIWNTYNFPAWRSPAERSALYDLCREALNIEKIEDIDAPIRKICYTAFENYLISISSDDDSNKYNRKKIIENEMNGEYFDPISHQIRTEIHPMIENITSSIPTGTKVSKVTFTMTALGALIAAAPGYGVGYAVGFALAQTNKAVPPKMEFSKLTGYAMTVVFNSKGKYLSYYASNLVVDAALERAFAKIFEALAMISGATAGGLLGLVIYDFSYQTLRNLCLTYMDVKKQVDPNLIKDADPKFIECLLNLPSEVFANEQKIIVQNLTQFGLFGQSAENNMDKQTSRDTVELNGMLFTDLTQDDEVIDLEMSDVSRLLTK